MSGLIDPAFATPVIEAARRHCVRVCYARRAGVTRVAEVLVAPAR